MAKIRVFQIASEIGFDKNRLVALCKQNGIDVKSPLSSVEDDLANQIRALIKTDEMSGASSADGVIRSMRDLPSISSDDLEKGKVPISSETAEKAEPEKAEASPVAEIVPEKKQEAEPSKTKSTPRSSQPEPLPGRQPRKKVAMTEFERQQAKIAKRKKQKEKAQSRAERREMQKIKDAEEARTLYLTEGGSPGELADDMGVSANEIISKLFAMGIMASINQKLDMDTCAIIAEEYGYMVAEDTGNEELIDLDFEDAEDTLQPREAIVTVMGHVDHGKTTLLDYIRKAEVAAGEAGGITQHIGAYKVSTKSGQSVCFLDTPGHEAFTAMRAHGSQITDIAILVVAADDSVKPQTLEAINHAKNADVPIIVAITKIDRPDVNPQRVYEDLGANGLIVEEWGGTVPSQGVSGITGEGVDDLLELVAIQADLMELKANPKRTGAGVVVEAGQQKGRGSVATILVQKGTISVGDIMVAGTSSGRIRSLTDEYGRKVDQAGPSTPVEITGFDHVPEFADRFFTVDSEKVARNFVEQRVARAKDQMVRGADKVVSLENLFAKVEEGKLKELKVIVKADVHGSVIAMSESLEKIHKEDVRVKVIHSGVGSVSESDIMLASASGAIIMCFHVRTDTKTVNLAEEHEVEIRNYRIIYEAIEHIEKAITGMLDPKYKEVVLGRATCRDVFAISRVGKIAGCFVDSGKVLRGKEARVIRDGVEVFNGKVESINRFKESVNEVLSGYECGINLRYNDLKVSDVIEVFEMQEIPHD